MTTTQSANERLGLAPTEPRPPEETRPLADRRQTNPLLGDQKMKLGLFGTNCSYGLVMSHAPRTMLAKCAQIVLWPSIIIASGAAAMFSCVCATWLACITAKPCVGGGVGSAW